MKINQIKSALLGSVLLSGSVMAINVDQNFEGQWYRGADDNRTGWQLDYIKTGPEKGSLSVTGFIYADNGEPTWVAGNADIIAGQSKATFQLSEFVGGNLIDQGSVTGALFGDMTLEFNHCRSITANIDNIVSAYVSDSSATFELEPLDEIAGYQRDASVCPYQTRFSGCPAFALDTNQDKTCALSGTLQGDITLTNDTNWVLQGGVFVGEDGGQTANLTIQPGTRIMGVTGNDFMSVQRGSKIFAEGTANAPIVFTGPYNGSDEAAGPGNWGGLILNGRAPINICDDSVPLSQCEDIGEGGSGNYGGNDPEDSSGVLRYVRVQFGGYRINDEDELNGIAFQGVGRGTVVDHVQVHANEDDGVEFFGGTVNAKHLILTDIKDDSLDWTHGWNGSVQYVIVKQNPDANNDKERGIEADNYEENNDASPRSMPKIANATFIGAPSVNKTTTGMVLRRGTGANLSHFVVTGFEKCLDLDSDATFAAAGSPGNLTGTLTMENFVIDCDQNFEEEDGDAYTIESFFNAQMGNTAEAVNLDGIYPTSDTPRGFSLNREIYGDFFDSVDYSGAIGDKSQDWTRGWSEFLD